MRSVRALTILAIAGAYYPGAALAAETMTYTYDAKGRLVKVVHSGSVNSAVTTIITHDAADNRTNLKVSGATN